MRLNKKSQMEIIGLVIIVILITLGMLFMATFAFKKEPEKKSFTGEGLAYSVMGALMNLDVECLAYQDGNPKINWLPLGRELIKDCAEHHYNYPEFSNHMCKGKEGEIMHACDFLEEIITNLLSETLGEWRKHYEFHSNLLGLGENPELLIDITDQDEQGCPAERDSSDPFPISSDFGLIENILYICE